MSGNIEHLRACIPRCTVGMFGGLDPEPVTFHKLGAKVRKIFNICKFICKNRPF